MNINEAISDLGRPLSITPKEWMMSVEASLAEENELTEKAVMRMAAKKSDSEPEKKDIVVGGVETIDIGIDQIVQGIKIVYEGVKKADKGDAIPSLRKKVNKIKDLMDTAIVPYIKDICELSDGFEDVSEDQ